jgi:hypothetical protein
VRVAKVIAVLIFGPILGLITGFVLGVVAMPSQVPGDRSPGDGFLIMGCIFVCVLLSVLGSAALAWKIWFRSDAGPRSN